jgi:site-specific recombinase XerC
MESVSSMLGHTDIKTTQIYGKIIAQKVIKEMDGIDNLFNIDKKAQSSS